MFFMVVFLFLLPQVLLQIHFMLEIPDVNPPKIMKKWQKICVQNVNKNMGVVNDNAANVNKPSKPSTQGKSLHIAPS